jgi:hypothetical protein
MGISYVYCKDCCLEHICPIPSPSQSTEEGMYNPNPAAPQSSSENSPIFDYESTAATKPPLSTESIDSEVSSTIPLPAGKTESPPDCPLAQYLRQNVVTASWGTQELVDTFRIENLNFVTFYPEVETKKIAHVVQKQSWEYSNREVFRIDPDTIKSLGMIDGSFVVHFGSKYSKKALGCFYRAYKSSVVEPGTFLRFYVGQIMKSQFSGPEYSLDLFSSRCPEGSHESWVVDSSKTGNEMRFINHSHVPNVEYRMAYADGIDGAFPAVIAIDELTNNSELLADYDTPFEVSSLFSLFSFLFSLISSLFSYLSLYYPVFNSISSHMPFRPFLMLIW